MFSVHVSKCYNVLYAYQMLSNILCLCQMLHYIWCVHKNVTMYSVTMCLSSPVSELFAFLNALI